MTTDEFSFAFSELLSYFQADLSDSVKAVYFQHLKDYTKDEFSTGIFKLIENYPYQQFPKIAVIKEYLEGTADEKAENALKIALKTMQEIGSNNSVCFEDSKINAIISSVFGGWEFFGNCAFFGDSVETTTNRKRFVNAYKNIAGAKISHLIGSDERENRHTGYYDEANEYIYLAFNNGDLKKQKAKERRLMLAQRENKNNNALSEKLRLLAQSKKLKG